MSVRSSAPALAQLNFKPFTWQRTVLIDGLLRDNRQNITHGRSTAAETN
jgi:hypothetical protein